MVLGRIFRGSRSPHLTRVRCFFDEIPLKTSSSPFFLLVDEGLIEDGVVSIVLTISDDMKHERGR